MIEKKHAASAAEVQYGSDVVDIWTNGPETVQQARATSGTCDRVEHFDASLESHVLDI